MEMGDRRKQIQATLASLVERLKGLKEKALNEANTKAIFIEPLLGALGWDVSDPDVVEREHKVADGSVVDYALKLGEQPVIYLEAKPLHDSIDDRKVISKTVNYANNDGVKWCVLTNGQQYRVYKSNEKGDLAQKLLFEVSLEEAGREESVGKLLYLSRESLERGELDQWGTAVFLDARVRKALEKLMQNPPRKFLTLLVEQLDVKYPPAQLKAALARLATGQPSRAPGFTPGRRAVKAPASPYDHAHHFRNKPKDIEDLFTKLDTRIRQLDEPRISRSFLKFYIAYRVKQHFVCVEPQKGKLRIFLDLPFEQVPEPRAIVRDVSQVGHYGTGDTEITLSSAADLDYALSLIKLAYERTPK